MTPKQFILYTQWIGIVKNSGVKSAVSNQWCSRKNQNLYKYRAENHNNAEKINTRNDNSNCSPTSDFFSGNTKKLIILTIKVISLFFYFTIFALFVKKIIPWNVFIIFILVLYGLLTLFFLFYPIKNKNPKSESEKNQHEECKVL